jgi:hypothetical protein
MRSLHRISVSAIFISFCLTASGSDPWRPSAGAGEAGMGYVCIMRSSFWSSFHNQANLAFNKSFSAGFNYENRFNIRELANRTAGIIIPAGKASFGAVYNYFGYSDFRRETGGLACGLKLSEKIAAGVQIDYFSERTYGEYSNSQAISFETGVLIAASENIRMGIHLFNPLPESLNKYKLPSRLRVGTGIDLSSGLFAGIEAEMSTGSKLIIRTGFEYDTMKKIWLRGGFSTDNNSFSFGLGYRLKFAMMDIAFATHEKLGVTSSVSLIFNLKKKN